MWRRRKPGGNPEIEIGRRALLFFRRIEMKVLIVDDSMMIRKALERYSVQLKMEIVGTAGNGREAIDLFQKLSPDVVTLDITMPEMDGLSALKEMKKINPAAHVIVISALNSKDVMVQALNMGAAGYIVKPFTPEKLKEQFDEIAGA